MTNRLLLGPAGSGKTWRCLEEVRAILKAEPMGPPLLFVAPRQATYQIERQLLEAGGLKAFSRLHIVSFERLGSFLLESFHAPVPDVIGDHGRAMLLKAVCGGLENQLTAYGPAAARPGFTAGISGVLAEFRSRGVSPEGMRKLAEKGLVGGWLSRKLRDLALIEEGLSERLAGLKLADPSEHARLAAALLESLPAGPLFGGVWVDGFAQFAPVEERLLALLALRSQRLTVAVCLERLFENPPVWHSIWSTPWTGVASLRAAFEKAGAADFEVVELDRGRGRFEGNPPLAHLEASFGTPAPYSGGDAGKAVSVLECDTPEAEAVAAARLIRRHVLEGGRYREVAVLTRGLGSAHALIERIFKRYGIPVFLDQRKPEKHHPLLDLIRASLRVAIRGWRRADFIAAMKTGLLGGEAGEVHEFENNARRLGWDRGVWREWLQDGKAPGTVEVRHAFPLIAGPTRLLMRFSHAVSAESNGPGFARALRTFFQEAKVREVLVESSAAPGGVNPESTVWDALEAWLDEVERVFASTKFDAAQWLEIAEEAFSRFTIGLIPPVLDQVLLGNVDRSRNPDLRMVIVMGCNEGVFPAVVKEDGFLPESDRQVLSQEGCVLGPDPRARLSMERYLGYIAFTRASGRLVVSYSRRGTDGKPLNPSPLVDALRALFPGVETVWTEGSELDCLHPSELRHSFEKPVRSPVLPVESVTALYGNELNGSVSSLERFAACPFRFFVHAGLKAREREEFEVDPRSTGTFLHEVLQGLHERITASGRAWREVSEDEARAIVREVSAAVAPVLMGGLMVSTGLNRLGTELETERLCDVAAVMVSWASKTDFSPKLAEFGFGGPTDKLRFDLTLPGGRKLMLQGRIDRVDAALTTEGARVVVLDYKRGARKLDPALLEHGEQLQLLVYLAVLQEGGLGDGMKTIPAGAFYFRLSAASKKTDREKAAEQAAAGFYEGVYDVSQAARLGEGGFALKLKKDGTAMKGAFAPRTPEDFAALLAHSRALLTTFGERIFAGDIAIDPSMHSGKAACELCDFAGICRVDRWTHPFRVL